MLLLSLPLVTLALWLLGAAFYFRDSTTWASWLALFAYTLFFGFLALGVGSVPNIVNS